MSINKIFNKLFFQKHKIGEVVATKDDKSFRKLSAVKQTTPTISGVTPDNLDLRWLGLKQGTYKITVTSIAGGLRLAESDRSDPVTYIIE